MNCTGREMGGCSAKDAEYAKLSKQFCDFKGAYQTTTMKNSKIRRKD
jgi:hypothetical protein